MGTQICAETAVVRLLSEDQWEAVWVSSNGYRNDLPPAPFCNSKRRSVGGTLLGRVRVQKRHGTVHRMQKEKERLDYSPSTGVAFRCSEGRVHAGELSDR